MRAAVTYYDDNMIKAFGVVFQLANCCFVFVLVWMNNLYDQLFRSYTCVTRKCICIRDLVRRGDFGGHHAIETDLLHIGVSSFLLYKFN